MITKTERWSTPASGSSHGSSRPLGQAAVDAAKRFYMIRVPRRTWLVGLGLAVGIILAAGGSVQADERLSTPPTCSSPRSSSSPFIILDNQTYALCAVASCFVFNEVAYCKCDVKTGDSISLALKYDNGQDVCTVNKEGVENGYMVSTYSFPPWVLKPNGDMASYTCPRDFGWGLCPVRWRDLLQKRPGQSFPGMNKPLAKDEIICSCPITEHSPKEPVGYQIAGPYPCQKSFFQNCKHMTANNKTGSTLYIGVPTGTSRLITFLLYGKNPPAFECRLPLRETPALWRLVRHEDLAGGEHAAHTMVDGHLNAEDLSRGAAAQLARALLQGTHAIHAIVCAVRRFPLATCECPDRRELPIRLRPPDGSSCPFNRLRKKSRFWKNGHETGSQREPRSN